jgi:hypothetical protein
MLATDQWTEILEQIRAVVAAQPRRNAVANGMHALGLFIEGEINAEACARAVNVMASSLETAEPDTGGFTSVENLDAIRDALAAIATQILISPTRRTAKDVIDAMDRTLDAIRALQARGGE